MENWRHFSRGEEEEVRSRIKLLLPELIVLISCWEPSVENKDALKDHITRKGSNCHLHHLKNDKWMDGWQSTTASASKR